MTNRRRNLFILLFVIGLVLVSIVVIASKPTRLGLDLRGGTELVYQARPTPQNPTIDAADLDRSIEIIRQRTDKLGVAEPEISRLGNDSILVGLPDVQNADRAIEQVGDTAQLYFYDWEKNIVGNPDVAKGNQADQGFNRLYDAVIFASKREPECKNDECTTAGPTYYLFNKNSKELVTGPASQRSDLFLEADKPPPKSEQEIIAVPQGTKVVVGDKNTPDEPDQFFVLEDKPALNGDEIRNPEQNFDPQTNEPIVSFEFTDSGRQKFGDVTRAIAERGRASAPPGVNDSQSANQFSDSFAITLDDDVVSRAIINFVDNPAGIDGRNGAQISGIGDIQEAQDLANFIQIGALPVELELISQSTVSATLGQQALEQGLRAGIAGLILVLLFLILYYRFLGVVASLGLIVYGIFFFALVKMVPITMTLPGIAGLILTIGVAADANVVIFERIKEEARAGKSVSSAIVTGYRKGIGTIIDANVITLITAFILFVLATAGVKGFAFTLGVGTIVSLFTAVVFTQAFLGVFGRSRFLRSGALIGAGGEVRVRWHFDFTGMSKWFFSISGTILLVGALSFATAGLNLGIDFESGTRIEAGLERSASVEDVRGVLEGVGVNDAEIQEVQSDALGDNAVQIQAAELRPDQVGNVQTALDEQFGLVPEGFDNTSIGPTFGEQVARSAIYAVIFSLLVIAGYVAFRFQPKYAVPVMIAVAHDVLITAGVYSLVGREVNSATVAAFLTILGYSLYDTIIVFDRIRENVPRLPRAAFSQIVNRSMSEVLTRSLITGASSVFLVSVLFVFGGATLKDFAFAMMIGILSGTYSSIFIAAPVLTAWKEREPAYRQRRERIEDQNGGVVPPFPEENLIAKVENAPADMVPAAAAPSRADVGAPTSAPAPPPPTASPPAPRPAAPPPAARPEPQLEPGEGAPAATEPPAEGQGPAGVPEDGEGGVPADGEGAASSGLSEASAAALRREQSRRSGKRRRKHGRPK
ncbi:MAG: protein translocase subunit SecD [Solirubrobacterales bacterium]|nr:protein translocase subunit SecD [Solirubrobacterales bacterium]